MTQHRTLVTIISSLSLVAGAAWYWQEKRKSIDGKEEKIVPRSDAPIQEIQTTIQTEEDQPKRNRILAPNRITIVHGSVTGTCAKLAQDLYNTLQNLKLDNRSIQVGALEEWDWWDELIND